MQKNCPLAAHQWPVGATVALGAGQDYRLVWSKNNRRKFRIKRRWVVKPKLFGVVLEPPHSAGMAGEIPGLEGAMRIPPDDSLARREAGQFVDGSLYELLAQHPGLATLGVSAFRRRRFLNRPLGKLGILRLGEFLHQV